MDMTFNFMTLANGSFEGALRITDEPGHMIVPNLTDEEAWDLLRYIESIPTIATWLTGPIDIESVTRTDKTSVTAP